MKPIYLVMLLGITLAWGLHFSVIKATIEDVPPFAYVAARMGLVALLLTPFRRWQPGKMGRILTAGLCFGGLNYAFMFWGLKLTNASITAVVIESYVPIATLFSVVFLKETIGLPRVLGMTLALAGVLVIASGSSDATGSANLPLGAALIVMAGTCEAAGAIFVKTLTGVPPLCLLSWFGTVGAVVVALLSFFFETGQVAAFALPGGRDVLVALAYSVLIASIFAHASYYYLLQHVPVSQVAPSGLIASLFAVLFGVVLLGEPLTGRFLIGGAMTLLGVGVVVLRQTKKGAPVIPPEEAVT